MKTAAHGTSREKLVRFINFLGTVHNYTCFVSLIIESKDQGILAKEIHALGQTKQRIRSYEPTTQLLRDNAQFITVGQNYCVWCTSNLVSFFFPGNASYRMSIHLDGPRTRPRRPRAARFARGTDPVLVHTAPARARRA